MDMLVHVKNKVLIKRDMFINHQLKSIIQEYAHILLHKSTDSSKEQKEIEAESIAFVVCNRSRFVDMLKL